MARVCRDFHARVVKLDIGSAFCCGRSVNAADACCHRTNLKRHSSVRGTWKLRTCLQASVGTRTKKHVRWKKRPYVIAYAAPDKVSPTSLPCSLNQLIRTGPSNYFSHHCRTQQAPRRLVVLDYASWVFGACMMADQHHLTWPSRAAGIGRCYHAASFNGC